MKRILPSLFLTFLLASLPLATRAEWQAVEKVETYPVTGKSGLELYASIGERGPLLGGKVRSIAHTSFKLTWQRDYQTRGTACVLASAKPKLIITTVLPRPANGLPDPLRRNWETFVEGVHAHEKVHGEFIKDMVKEIEKATIGLAVDDDPKCQKIRQKMQPILGAISDAQRKKSRDFDSVELTSGGAVHQLVLRLVNGG